MLFDPSHLNFLSCNGNNLFWAVEEQNWCLHPSEGTFCPSRYCCLMLGNNVSVKHAIFIARE